MAMVAEPIAFINELVSLANTIDQVVRAFTGLAGDINRCAVVATSLVNVCRVLHGRLLNRPYDTGLRQSVELLRNCVRSFFRLILDVSVDTSRDNPLLGIDSFDQLLVTLIHGLGDKSLETRVQAIAQDHALLKMALREQKSELKTMKKNGQSKTPQYAKLEEVYRFLDALASAKKERSRAARVVAQGKAFVLADQYKSDLADAENEARRLLDIVNTHVALSPEDDRFQIRDSEASRIWGTNGGVVSLSTFVSLMDKIVRSDWDRQTLAWFLGYGGARGSPLEVGGFVASAHRWLLVSLDDDGLEIVTVHDWNLFTEAFGSPPSCFWEAIAFLMQPYYHLREKSSDEYVNENCWQARAEGRAMRLPCGSALVTVSNNALRSPQVCLPLRCLYVPNDKNRQHTVGGSLDLHVGPSFTHDASLASDARVLVHEVHESATGYIRKLSKNLTLLVTTSVDPQTLRALVSSGLSPKPDNSVHAVLPTPHVAMVDTTCRVETTDLAVIGPVRSACRLSATELCVAVPASGDDGPVDRASSSVVIVSMDSRDSSVSILSAGNLDETVTALHYHSNHFLCGTHGGSFGRVPWNTASRSSPSWRRNRIHALDASVTLVQPCGRNLLVVASSRSCVARVLNTILAPAGEPIFMPAAITAAVSTETLLWIGDARGDLGLVPLPGESGSHRGVTETHQVYVSVHVNARGGKALAAPVMSLFDIGSDEVLSIGRNDTRLQLWQRSRQDAEIVPSARRVVYDWTGREQEACLSKWGQILSADYDKKRNRLWCLHDKQVISVWSFSPSDSNIREIALLAARRATGDYYARLHICGRGLVLCGGRAPLQFIPFSVLLS